jgi:hypothetical protein
MSASRAIAGQQQRMRKSIAHYNAKVGAPASDFMFPRFDPSVNLSGLTFAFNINLITGIVSETGVIFPAPVKAQYEVARYDVDKYDPLAPIGILIPNTITEYLYIYIVRHFTYGSRRGYKYSTTMAFQMFDSEAQIFTQFAPLPVWTPRIRKIEGWRNWTAFYNLALYNVNPYPTDQVFIRVTDSPSAFGNPVAARTVMNDNLSSNLYGHGVYGYSFYPSTAAPYPEVLLLSPNLQCYQPVYNIANYGYDVYYDIVVFDPNIMTNVVSSFQETQNPIYRQLVWLTGSPRMQTMYAIHATYQHDVRSKIENALANRISSPILISQYYAFALEYSYARKFMQLVTAQNVIQKYVKLGLDEALLNTIAQLTQR